MWVIQGIKKSLAFIKLVMEKATAAIRKMQTRTELGSPCAATVEQPSIRVKRSRAEISAQLERDKYDSIRKIAERNRRARV